jgi:hypothetical protein
MTLKDLEIQVTLEHEKAFQEVLKNIQFPGRSEINWDWIIPVGLAKMLQDIGPPPDPNLNEDQKYLLELLGIRD